MIKKKGPVMKYFMLFIPSLFVLGACQTSVSGKAPDVKVKGDGYEVEIKDDNGHGDFCPPGQAKKGNC